MMPGDRRRRDVGPPGVERRRGAPGRRATDALKMSCPFCGASESHVVRSHGSVTTDRVRRRRQCAECGRRFPTSERVDRELLEVELDVHVDRAVFEPPPPTWENAEMLLHRLWGQAKDGEYVKADWRAFQQVLGDLKQS